MKVQLVSKTQGVGKYENLQTEEIIAAIARHGVIKEDNGKLVRYLMDNKHWSPLDMVNFTFEIETSRAIGRQMLRHASIKPQEHCVTGDTLITTETSGRSVKVRIDKLWKRFNSKQYWDNSLNLVRTFDFKSKTFVKSKIKEVFYNGVRDVYLVKLSNGKSIKSTLSHKYFDFKTQEFIPLSSLKVGDFIAINGVPVHQSKEWLSEAKVESINNKLGLPYTCIESIEYVGKEDVYDLEVEDENHNYIANGIVVHNSQRYSDKLNFEPIELRKEHPTNRQSSTDVFDPMIPAQKFKFLEGEAHLDAKASAVVEELLDNIQNVYFSLIEAGVAKECARMILPECTSSTLSFNGTLRSWLSFLNVRCDHHTQKELVEIATLIGTELEKELPNIFKAIDWRNGMFM